eukprot:gene19023-22743_t
MFATFIFTCFAIGASGQPVYDRGEHVATLRAFNAQLPLVETFINDSFGPGGDCIDVNDYYDSDVFSTSNSTSALNASEDSNKEYMLTVERVGSTLSTTVKIQHDLDYAIREHRRKTARVHELRQELPEGFEHNLSTEDSTALITSQQQQVQTLMRLVEAMHAL